MPGTYSTDTLIGVVEGLPAPTSALLDRYFTATQQDESEEIHFDTIKSKRRITPFVSPLVAGQVVESLGYETSTFKPAYTKDKRVFDPSRPLKRAVGEKIGGSLTPEQRRDAYTTTELQDQTQMLTRRFEVMASEIIRKGTCTVEGEKYPRVVVNFKRDAALTFAALAGTAKWGAADATIRKNLKDMAKVVRQKSGTNPVDLIMGEDAADAFMNDAEIMELLDNRNITGQTLQPGTEIVEGLTYHGTIDRRNIFSYAGTYVDPLDDTEKDIWPADEIALVSNAILGVRCFGAIRDGKAGFRAMQFFAKMWEDEDPSVEYLLMQSAPLMVPARPNASAGRKVL